MKKILKIKKYFLGILLFFGFALANFVFATDGIGEQKEIKFNNGKAMHAYVKGSGDKTIVMLSGWGTENPINDFKPLADKLSDKFRVVILEYFGYGSSDITENERTNENIVNEIRTALDKLGIKPPYILIPHSMSGLYSLYYADKYPNEVKMIIGIDMSLPQKQLERWQNGSFKKLSSEELDGANVSIVNQWNEFYDNSKELENVKYPSNLPVLAFLATEQVGSVDSMIKSGSMKTSWEDINKNIVTNPEIQSIEVLEGTHYLHHKQADTISQISKEFIDKHLIK